MKKKQLFKFSGTIEDSQRSRTINFYGYFVKKGKNEIVGINKENGEDYFIKGLFINYTQLIFVEMTAKEKRRRKRGFAFNDTKEIGCYSKEDWLAGLFSGESDERPAHIQIKKVIDSRKTKDLLKRFQEFYESLDDFYQDFFDTTQQLKRYLK